jgi:hypothetical protein
MIIHPAVWKQVNKMYLWFYKTDLEIKKVFDALNLHITSVGLENLEEVLNNLSYEEGLMIIKDVLQIEDFWLTQNDFIRLRNSRRDMELMRILPQLSQPLEYTPPEQRLFGEQLCKHLINFCGIVYDRETNTLSVQDTGGIHQIAKVVNSQLLVKSEFEDYFIISIVQELNGVYRAGFYNSTLILSRKLFENLMIKLLEHKYPRNVDGNLHLYFDASQNRYRDFSVLIKVLRDRNAEFNDGNSTIQRFLTKIEKLTEITNPTAHKLTYNASRDDVISLEIEELLELYKKIAELVSLNGIIK